VVDDDGGTSGTADKIFTFFYFIFTVFLFFMPCFLFGLPHSTLQYVTLRATPAVAPSAVTLTARTVVVCEMVSGDV
jgi:hypothetical protein